MTKQAVIDAQRLVIINPKSGKDRLLLAQVYRASGNRKEVLRTLWEAFQDLPEDEMVVSALQEALVSAGDADGKQRLTEEYADRRKATLTKELS
jgi:predicted Zn-dependent protease